jgi:photosystem II stability/assembly factor-like uncharacterized protein
MRIISRALALLFLAVPLLAQTTSTNIDPSQYSGLRWRLLGPFRAGRVSSVAGVPTDPTVYYIATPDGGVWKTSDAGRVWRPTMDATGVSSIGAVAVAPSSPNVVYAGSGEESVGQGMFKSTDAGATWTNIGLKDSRYISGIIVDPRNADVLTVAVSGPMDASDERGVYRSTDGGRTWKRVLFIDNVTGAVDIGSTTDSKIQMVSMAVRPSPPPQQRPTPAKPDASKGEKEPVERGPGSMIYISTNGGATWKAAGNAGLPAEKRGRIGVAVGGNRMFAIMDKGLFRSEDQGKSWKQITTDARIIGASYFSKVFVSPKNADEVYVAQTSMYRSRDGGLHFESWNGAPSGDDIHTMWINPSDPRHMILGVDQGAIISMNAGATWTEWFNQATGQFYHVTTDNQFPYHAYAAQQDSGSIATVSRSDYGEITYRDWYSPAAFEVAHILADPLDPDSIYGSGWYSTLIRYSRSTGQFKHLFVPGTENRAATAPPIAFDPFDPARLLLGAQRVMVTSDRGETWKAISPELTGGIPADLANKKPSDRRRPPALTEVAHSHLEKGLIWAGSGDGLIHVTHDGQSRQKVTPTKENSDLNLEDLQKDQEAKLPPSAFTPGGVAMIEPGHFNAGTAFAIYQIARDPIPLVVRTRDFGQHWQSIAKGLPQEMAWAVREDPVRPGLLYAAIGHAVFVSFDEGDHWQSLQLNLPVSQMRDLNVHGDDLVVATFGRALWVLDDLTPLRQVAPEITSSVAHLFKPSTAVRVHWDMNTDTPLPPETPAAANPPDGASIYYYLRTAPKQIAMDIRDSRGNVVSHFDTTPEPPPAEPPNAPEYWFAPATTLPTAAGLNRFTWNLRYPHPPVLSYGYFGAHLDYFEYTLPDHAIASETPRWQPDGPLVPPGNYEVVLTVDGQTYRQPLEVKPDPRIKVPAADYDAQFATQLRLERGMAATFDAWHQAHEMRTKLKPKNSPAAEPDAEESSKEAKPKTLDDQLKDFEDGTRERPGFGPLNRDLGRLMEMAGTADGKPSQMLQQAVDQLCGELDKRLTEWKEFGTQHPGDANMKIPAGCGK